MSKLKRIYLTEPHDDFTTFVFDTGRVIGLSADRMPSVNLLDTLLTPEEAAALIPILQRFVDTGSIEPSVPAKAVETGSIEEKVK